MIMIAEKIAYLSADGVTPKYATQIAKATAGGQFDRRIAQRNVRAAMAAFRAQQDIAQYRNVVVPGDGLFAKRAEGARRRDHG